MKINLGLDLKGNDCPMLSNINAKRERLPTRALWRGRFFSGLKECSWGTTASHDFLIHLSPETSAWLFPQSLALGTCQSQSQDLPGWAQLLSAFFAILKPLLTSLLPLSFWLLRWSCKQTVDFPQTSSLPHCYKKLVLFSDWFLKIHKLLTSLYFYLLQVSNDFSEVKPC